MLVLRIKIRGKCLLLNMGVCFDQEKLVFVCVCKRECLPWFGVVLLDIDVIAAT